MIDIKGIRYVKPYYPLRLPPMPTVGLNDLGGAVKFYIGVNISVDEMREWSPQRITNFFSGIAQVVATRGKPQ